MSRSREDRSRTAGKARKKQRAEPGVVSNPAEDRGFGALLRERREGLRATDRSFSLRQVAERGGVEPSYLSKVERGEVAPPSEETILRLATELDLDPDALRLPAATVTGDLREVIRRRPELFGRLIRELRDLPDHAVLRIAREVRDGEW